MSDSFAVKSKPSKSLPDSASWQDYVEYLLSTGMLDAAGIYGQEGGVWAHSEEWDVPSATITEMVPHLKSHGARVPTSIVVNGKSYMVVRVDSNDGTAYARAGSSGVVLTLTTLGVIVCRHSSEKANAGQANLAVRRLADHLRQAGV
mmetsp:Transcript_34649/g.87095  ORF Transcript_34649/g.87095 Transcript_34649/m.87095 type:complete len:147 (+) Transcript_34649:1125-1565(+)|eukprot:CAMPEP_0174241416 /NCGR_PEP_ID=MMETSP0417-20130205/23317_1 /TAXON_ID=242541 /ORGANISM="Mayorella sp, Strain BSH-02190019" /LENGTH=146 /DNA_ID=CAMNT_0015320655 /DNA_START=36 /DNA_END=476 /DNA_ORIENTATION=+